MKNIKITKRTNLSKLPMYNLKGECDEFVAYFCDNCGRLPKACKRCIKCGGKVIRAVAG